jgi:TRAP-type C4-dicarboxylate transport system permease small subunit
LIEKLENAADSLKRFNRHIDRVSGAVLNISVTAIFVIIVVSVFCRYVLRDALTWSEEVAKFTLVWMCFIGASTVMIRGGHVSIQVFYSWMRGVAKVILVIFTELVILITLGLIAWYGWDITLTAFPQRSPVVPWLSLGAVYISMPLGALMMFPISTELMLRNLAAGIKNLERESTATPTS